MTVPIFPTLGGAASTGLPVNIAMPVKRGVTASRQRERAFSGALTSYPNWSYPFYRFSISSDYLSAVAAISDWQNLMGFWELVQFGSGLFRFTAPNDNSVIAQAFGTGNGVTTQFQLVRTLGGSTSPVYAVNTAQIFVDGVLKTVTTDYTIDGYGVVTFTSAPANTKVVTWTGTYYFYCQFDTDSVDFEMFLANIYRCQELSFSTAKFGSV